MKKINEFIKEFKIMLGSLLAFITLLGVSPTVITDWIIWYNIHIIIYSTFASTLSFILVMRIVNKLHQISIDEFKDQKDQIANILLNNARQGCRGRIKQAFEDYKDFDEITLRTSIMYLKDLESERVELKLNSYTEDMMQILLGKIKLV